MTKRSEHGFTVVELLIGLVITAIVAVAVAQVLGVTSAALVKSGDRVVVATQAVRFTTLLKYDMSGASDVYVFDGTAPNSAAHLCSSWTSSSTSAWTNTSDAQFVRELFSVQIPSLTPPSTPGPLQRFLPSKTQLVGYEIRRQSNGAYDLQRVVCEPDASQQWQIVHAQRALSLGKTLGAEPTGVASLRCIDAAGYQLSLPVGEPLLSGALHCASFEFVPPTTSRALTQALGDTSLHRLSSVVTG